MTDEVSFDSKMEQRKLIIGFTPERGGVSGFLTTSQVERSALTVYLFVYLCPWWFFLSWSCDL